MGLADRDYMRDRHKVQRHADASASAAIPKTLRHWTIALAVIGTAALVYFIAKTTIESRTAIPFPKTGEVFWYVPEDGNDGAPLTVSAPADASRNFAVRLSDWSNGRLVLMVPIRGGETAQLKVPLGQYQITIASGKNWQGPEKMFGAAGEVRKAVAPMHFYRTGNQTTGHRIDLTSRLNGNLETRAATVFDK